MAWYSDEEYELRQDCREKKSIAASAFKQRTHCGKSGCKLPSDFMTKKEIKAMNGEVVNYASVKRPMNWEEFKKLPDDLKKEYVEFIREKFNAPNNAIADMFCVHAATFGKHLHMIGIRNDENRGRNTKWDKHGFDVWRGAILELPAIPVAAEVVLEASETPVEAVEAEIDIPAESKVEENQSCSYGHTERKRAIPANGKMTFDGPIEEIVETLRMLLGGAEVTLDVAWSVIETGEEE